ncbi:phosphoglycerate mutase-like protein [Bradyrhizobium diazoefficiens]|nr:phosphoglycerate mutase-like protein [Bradyrhizobium diazoefficiens]
MRHNRKYRPSAFRTYEEWAIRARERRTAVTVSEFRAPVIKDRLTLWFYCVKQAARRHEIGGEPRKTKSPAGMRASVRRGIAIC